MKKILFAAIIMLFSITVIQAQKKDKKENLLIKLQEGAKPLIYVDGKVFDFPMELIDQSKIASIMVVKKQDAIKKYNAPNGVVLIQTKEAASIKFSDVKLKDNQRIGRKNGPKVIIDGKVSNKKALDKLKPDQIEKMKIIKGKQAIKKYNASNGVILITTKKKKGN
jgi:predicted metallo-beta-lactamase superfamily hydrolase